MRQAATFVRWVSLALILGVLVLHIPLDAFRSPGDARVVSSCCCPTPGVSHDACDEPRGDVGGDDDGASAPLPKDGCESGCHCGCCGGLPLALEGDASPRADSPGAPSSMPDPRGVRGGRPLEVFHPPRA